MNARAALIAFVLAMPAAPAAMAADSVYTMLDFNHGGCEQVGGPRSQEDIDLGSQSLLCKGYKDYLVTYDQGDERTTVHFGGPGEVTTTRGWESFASFNSTADRIEWRVDAKGIAHAAIYRALLSIVNPAPGKSDETMRGQILVISAVGQADGPAGCVIGLVDALANADANQMARDIADQTASTFKCGKDTAVYHGKRGDKTSDFTASFTE